MESLRPSSACARLGAVLISLAIVGGAAAPVAAQDAPPQLPRPCEAGERHGQLDFWLGDWRVLGGEGEELGRSRITKDHGGCVLEEHWTSARGGGSGEGLYFIDPEDGRWHQVWVGSTGTVVRYEGELRDGTMRFQGRATSADGTTVLSRATVDPLPDGGVRQRVERSSDGGATWRRYFEGTYVPVADRDEAARPAPPPPPAPGPPAPAPAPAPADPPASPEPPPPSPAPARSGEVTAISVEVPDAEVPAEERAKVHLESPMVLELPVGPVETLPAGYSWRTAETARFVAGGASIRQVTVSRDERRQRVDLRVTPALHGERYLQHAALDVELVVDGEVVAAAGLDEFPLGRSLQAQSQGAGVEKQVVLPLDREIFERAFGGEERPVLRLRLTVRE